VGKVRGLRETANRYLEECFERRSPPRVSELANQLRCTPRQLSGRFLAEAGILPSEYLKLAQIERAKVLLRSTDLTLDAICGAAAFGTRTTFFRAFKSRVGVSPAAFRLAFRQHL
jgi:AraC family transcriptional activator FtrA